MADERDKPTRTLHQRRYQLAEHARQVHWIVPEEGTTIEEILAPDYWAHVARFLHAYDEIIVQFEDQPRRVDLQVLFASDYRASVAILREYKFKELEIPEGQAALKPVFKGPQRRWTVQRQADGVFIKEGIQTKEEAEAYIRDTSKIMAAA